MNGEYGMINTPKHQWRIAMCPRGMTVVDRVGQRVGKLVVLKRAANRQEGNSIRACWVCKCDCGNEIIVRGHDLSKALSGKGGVQSCGCMLKEKPIKHGMANTRIYGLWHSMLQRCENQKNPAYKSYGGRGITVCEEWHNFANFYRDMGQPPGNWTLDRIDNHKGYSKENCRWASRKTQGNNRRTNLYLSLNGIKMTLSQWSDHTGLTTYCITSRLKSGWSVEKALTHPKRINQHS